MSGYIGTQPVPQATQTRDSFTATSGQTSFATGGYTPTFLDVFLNGVKLAAADYTASNGSDVVLATGATTGDILEVVAYTTFDTANVTGAANFTVTGSFTSQGIDDNANATAITIDSSENVGIGTSSPGDTSEGAGLRVNSYVTRNQYYSPAGSYAGSFGLTSNATPNIWLSIDSGYSQGSADSAGIFLSAYHGDANGSSAGYTIKNTRTSEGLIFSNVSAATSVGSPATETERMRIDSSGNLLVGSTNNSPATNNVAGSLHGSLGNIQASVDGNPCLFVNRKSNDGDIISLRKDGSSVGSIGSRSGSANIYIESGGSGRLRANGTDVVGWNSANLALFSHLDGGSDLGTSGNRFKDGHFSGTVNAANFNTTSDATLKTNVETLTGSLDAVKSLRGVSYDWIESGGSEIGVIAQEVEAVLPDVVSTNDEGIKSVKYGNMVAVLIEAIKEQQVQIDELKAQLNS